LKELLRSVEPEADLTAVLHEIVSASSGPTGNYPPHFFEVELKKLLAQRGITYEILFSFLTNLGEARKNAK